MTTKKQPQTDYARLMESHIAVLQENTRLRDALDAIKQAQQAQEPVEVEDLADVAYRAWQDKTTFDLGKVRAEFRAALAAPKQAEPDPLLEIETALSELVDKICPGLDSGDLLADARTASKNLSFLTEPTMGVRESLEDALAIVESFGPGIAGMNDTYARQILLAEEVKRLRSENPWEPVEEMQEQMAEMARIISTNSFYQDGHKDGLEWAAQCVEYNDPRTGDWMWDDRHDLANVIRKGPEMPETLPAPKQAEPEGYKLVPEIPTEAQWNGLARDVMMWLDMDGRHTAGSLFKHLERCGTEIPQWLRDEPEMKNLDHVPSKGTRVAIIYRAMLAAAPTPPEAA